MSRSVTFITRIMQYNCSSYKEKNLTYKHLKCLTRKLHSWSSYIHLTFSLSVLGNNEQINLNHKIEENNNVPKNKILKGIKFNSKCISVKPTKKI